MRRPKGFPNHNCCPKEWRNTPNITGSFELDAAIKMTRNKDMADRIKDHISDEPTAYNHRNAYNSTSRD